MSAAECAQQRQCTRQRQHVRWPARQHVPLCATIPCVRAMHGWLCVCMRPCAHDTQTAAARTRPGHVATCLAGETRAATGNLTCGATTWLLACDVALGTRAVSMGVLCCGCPCPSAGAVPGASNAIVQRPATSAVGLCATCCCAITVQYPAAPRPSAGALPGASTTIVQCRATRWLAHYLVLRAIVQYLAALCAFAGAAACSRYCAGGCAWTSRTLHNGSAGTRQRDATWSVRRRCATA